MLFFDSALTQDYNDGIVSFLVHHLLPLLEYLFFAGLIGAVPVIVITAIKTAQSMLEED